MKTLFLHASWCGARNLQDFEILPDISRWKSFEVLFQYCTLNWSWGPSSRNKFIQKLINFALRNLVPKVLVGSECTQDIQEDHQFWFVSFDLKARTVVTCWVLESISWKPLMTDTTKKIACEIISKPITELVKTDLKTK